MQPSAGFPDNARQPLEQAAIACIVPRRRSPGDSRFKYDRRGIVYLNKHRERRGRRTQWRFRNVLRYGRDTRWTAA
ncbi:MAG: hypothetical protein QOC89_208 [Paraburkholderia sp.]|nr:hypothetical protein [Paraburkholderia sp.]MEA3130221.1 hypothetical protein [Paraburkholderia sp.]